MKSLKTILTESKEKYLVNWIDKDGKNFRINTNDYKASLKDLQGKYEYYEVMDTSYPNLTVPDGLIEWSGEGGYWDNVWVASNEDENGPQMFAVFRGDDLKKIERCRK